VSYSSGRNEGDREFAKWQLSRLPKLVLKLKISYRTWLLTGKTSPTRTVPHKVNFINVTDVKFNHAAFFEDIAVDYAIAPTMIELMGS